MLAFGYLDSSGRLRALSADIEHAAMNAWLNKRPIVAAVECAADGAVHAGAPIVAQLCADCTREVRYDYDAWLLSGAAARVPLRHADDWSMICGEVGR